MAALHGPGLTAQRSVGSICEAWCRGLAQPAAPVALWRSFWRRQHVRVADALACLPQLQALDSPDHCMASRGADAVLAALHRCSALRELHVATQRLVLQRNCETPVRSALQLSALRLAAGSPDAQGAEWAACLAACKLRSVRWITVVACSVDLHIVTDLW